MNIDSLQAIMLSIASSRSLGQILDEIVRGVGDAFDLALARLWLIERDIDCPFCSEKALHPSTAPALHLRSSTGSSRRTGGGYSSIGGGFHRLAIGERKIGQIAASGEPMLISSVKGDEPWAADPEWIAAEGIQSFAGQPLVFRGEVLGVLAIFSRSQLSGEEFKWLRTFADHAAVAIANAKAFNDLDRFREQLEAENEYLNEEIRGTLQFGEIVGESGALKKVLEQVALVAETAATVLIQGESGTGKELIARAIHDRGSRRGRAFIKVNCGAIPDELFESEFFGHVKGAFTGAVKDRVGRFELADGGDIFLDEIAEIPLGLQAKLLRVLQERQFERVGEARTRTVDVRVIAATNRDLKRAVEEGSFREDLYYRLTVFPIELPPLRERKEDLPVLAEHFLRKSAARLKLQPPRLTREQARQLQEYEWPGNIRELENVIERATILSQGTGRLRFELRPQVSRAQPARTAVKNAPVAEPSVLTKGQLREREIENILAALLQSGGKVFGPGGAAEILGMRPTTLASRVKALGLKKAYLPPGE